MSEKHPIPYGKHCISQADIDAVVSVLKSDFLTQGPKVAEFEEAFADYVGSKYAIAVSNGTAALHLSVLALGLKPGERVLTSPITFAASANCVRFCGGEVEFVDIDPHTYLMDLNQLEDKLKTGNYKGIIPVDFTGLSVNMELVQGLAERYGCWILEDACHAPGGSFENSHGEKVMVGNGQYADAAIFSFHPVKHIAAGEGGMVTTNRKDIADRIAIMRTHGISKGPVFKNENDGGWYYEMIELGYNYRLSDIQAALGRSQLHGARTGIIRRRQIARKYDEYFAQVDNIKVQKVTSTIRDDHHAYHLYIIRTKNRKSLYDHLQSQSILAQVHYIPVHQLPYYQKRYGKQSLPHAEQYYRECLSLPMYPSMKNGDQEKICNTIHSYIDNHGL